MIVYDALFLSLAEYAGTVMITADYKLLRVLEGTEYAGLVCPLAGIYDLLR